MCDFTRQRSCSTVAVCWNWSCCLQDAPHLITRQRCCSAVAALLPSRCTQSQQVSRFAGVPSRQRSCSAVAALLSSRCTKSQQVSRFSGVPKNTIAHMQHSCGSILESLLATCQSLQFSGVQTPEKNSAVGTFFPMSPAPRARFSCSRNKA